jgi:hypothetical protein
MVKATDQIRRTLWLEQTDSIAAISSLRNQ